MKKVLILFCASMATAFTGMAQVQYKIPDPKIDAGINELKAAGFYQKQLKDLGFKDSDIKIKTYPLWKFYSESAGMVTRNMTEADGAAFHVEATTEKDAKGVIYKMEGNIIFSRVDRVADSWGSYNSNILNSWKVYHLNVTDFIPANQKYIVAPEIVKTMFISGLCDGTIKSDFVPITSRGFYDLIYFRSMTYVTDEMAKNSEYKTLILNGKEQRMTFFIDLDIAYFSADSQKIYEIVNKQKLPVKLYVKLKDGEPKISLCSYWPVEQEHKIFSKDFGKEEVYDTLFAGSKMIGVKNILGKRRVISAQVLQGAAKKEFFENFSKAFLKLSGNETEEELNKLFYNYVTKIELTRLVSYIKESYKKGFNPGKELENLYNGRALTWVPKTRDAKKLPNHMWPKKYEIVFDDMAYIRLENLSYKYQQLN